MVTQTFWTKTGLKFAEFTSIHQDSLDYKNSFDLSDEIILGDFGTHEFENHATIMFGHKETPYSTSVEKPWLNHNPAKFLQNLPQFGLNGELP